MCDRGAQKGPLLGLLQWLRQADLATWTCETGKGQIAVVVSLSKLVLRS